MTVSENEVYEPDEFEDEVITPRAWCTPTKFLLDAVSDCSSLAVTFGVACLIVLPLVLMSEGSEHDITGHAELSILSAGLFSCAAGIACKVAACCAEDEEEPEAHVVEMV